MLNYKQGLRSHLAIYVIFIIQLRVPVDEGTRNYHET